MGIEEILIIKNGNESYGIPTKEINQIARVPMLMPLPLRPYGVRGLCAVSGNIVTMVDMNTLLKLDQVDIENDKSRVIVLNDPHSHATLLVSEVYNTVDVDESHIDYIDKDDDPIIAIYKYKDSLIQVISLEILFSRINKVSIESEEVKNGKVQEEVTKEEDTSRFLTFAMGDELYALSIEYLREIILADREFTEVAGTADEVVGLITLRDELLLVVDLRKHYGFAPHVSDKNRILIASHDGKHIGLLVDEILDISSYPLKDIETMKGDFQDNKIAGIIHTKDSIISFFDADVLENLFEENSSFIDEEKEISQVESLNDDVYEVIVFKLAGKEYSFEVEKISEIIDNVASTQVAYTDENIDGIINIRGQIVTMVSLFKKLNLEVTTSEDSKIIVCEIDGAKLGFVVDSVSDILNVPFDDVRELEDEFFKKVLHLENGNRLVLSMDIDEIAS